jgi:hypothetical protein
MLYDTLKAGLRKVTGRWRVITVKDGYRTLFSSNSCCNIYAYFNIIFCSRLQGYP